MVIVAYKQTKKCVFSLRESRAEKRAADVVLGRILALMGFLTGERKTPKSELISLK
jgi:hypothetical protein